MLIDCMVIDYNIVYTDLASGYIYNIPAQGEVTTMHTTLPFATAVKMWSKGQGGILMLVKGSTW